MVPERLENSKCSFQDLFDYCCDFRPKFTYFVKFQPSETGRVRLFRTHETDPKSLYHQAFAEGCMLVLQQRWLKSEATGHLLTGQVRQKPGWRTPASSLCSPRSASSRRAGGLPRGREVPHPAPRDSFGPHSLAARDSARHSLAPHCGSGPTATRTSPRLWRHGARPLAPLHVPSLLVVERLRPAARRDRPGLGQGQAESHFLTSPANGPPSEQSTTVDDDLSEQIALRSRPNVSFRRVLANRVPRDPLSSAWVGVSELSLAATGCQPPLSELWIGKSRAAGRLDAGV